MCLCKLEFISRIGLVICMMYISLVASLILTQEVIRDHHLWAGDGKKFAFFLEVSEILNSI